MRKLLEASNLRGVIICPKIKVSLNEERSHAWDK